MSKKNNKFSSRIGFLAAASGAAIGLGNIWKFPYEVGIHGGACFLFLYLLFTVIFGYPIVLVKIAFGRSLKNGVYKGYLKEKYWKYLSLAPAVLCLVLFSFYTIITGWILGYSLELLNGSLFLENDISQFFLSFVKNIPITLFYTVIINIIITIIISLGVQNGIEMSSKVLMPLFIIVLLCLIVYAFTLNGTSRALKFYLLPNFSLITKKSFASALSQCFLSLAIGSSVMITYGAYAKNNINLIKDSSIIVIADFAVAFLAGLLIFPLIFSNNLKSNEGPSLIFIALPYVFKNLGFIGNIVGISFFLLLVFAALTSAIPMMEIPTNYIKDRWNISRSKSVIIVSFLALFLSFPSIMSFKELTIFNEFVKIKGKILNFFDFLSFITIDLGMPIIGLFFCIFIRKRWRKYQIDQQLKSSYRYHKYFLKYIYVCVCYLSPILISLILLFNLL